MCLERVCHANAICCSFQNECLEIVCPIDQFIVQDRCVSLAISSAGVRYHVDFFLIFARKIQEHEYSLLTMVLELQLKEVFSPCAVCTVDLFATHYIIDTVFVAKLSVVTTMECGEHQLSETLQVIEESTFETNITDYHAVVTNFDLFISPLAQLPNYFNDDQCVDRNKKTYLTVTSHYFCKSVKIDSSLALQIDAKRSNSTMKHMGSELSYVCVDDFEAFVISSSKCQRHGTGTYILSLMILSVACL